MQIVCKILFFFFFQNQYYFVSLDHKTVIDQLFKIIAVQHQLLDQSLFLVEMMFLHGKYFTSRCGRVIENQQS